MNLRWSFVVYNYLTECANFVERHLPQTMYSHQSHCNYSPHTVINSTDGDVLQSITMLHDISFHNVMENVSACGIDEFNDRV